MVDGWMKLLVYVALRLDIWVAFSIQGHQHRVIQTMMEKERWKSSIWEVIRTPHGERRKLAVLLVRVSSLHPMDQVITLPQTKQERYVRNMIHIDIYYISSYNKYLRKIYQHILRFNCVLVWIIWSLCISINTTEL